MEIVSAFQVKGAKCEKVQLDANLKTLTELGSIRRVVSDAEQRLEQPGPNFKELLKNYLAWNFFLDKNRITNQISIFCLLLVTGIQLLFAYPENHVEIWLVILFLWSNFFFFMKQIFVLSSFMKMGPGQWGDRQDDTLWLRRDFAGIQKPSFTWSKAKKASLIEGYMLVTCLWRSLEMSSTSISPSPSRMGFTLFIKQKRTLSKIWNATWRESGK